MIKTGFGRNYVINLKRHPGRLKSALTLLGEENTTVIEGIDGYMMEGHRDWLKENMSNVVRDPNGWWTVGIVACALSHKKAWKAFLDSGEPTACFFEDDVIASPYLDLDVIEEIKDGVDDYNWGCIFLGKYEDKIDLVNSVDKVMPLRDANANWGMYSRFQKNQYAAHAYVLSRKGAQWYYDKMDKVSLAADVHLEWTPLDIFASKANMFEQIKRHSQRLPEYYPYEHLQKDPENAVSHTSWDGEVNDGLLIGASLKLISKEYSSWRMGPARVDFDGYKLTFDL
tara:strand:+ start:467 stop:1318 length:852 start_codon:yes stop_codon:yes gene_type:complete